MNMLFLLAFGTLLAAECTGGRDVCIAIEGCIYEGDKCKADPCVGRRPEGNCKEVPMCAWDETAKKCKADACVSTNCEGANCHMVTFNVDATEDHCVRDTIVYDGTDDCNQWDTQQECDYNAQCIWDGKKAGFPKCNEDPCYEHDDADKCGGDDKCHWVQPANTWEYEHEICINKDFDGDSCKRATTLRECASQILCTWNENKCLADACTHIPDETEKKCKEFHADCRWYRPDSNYNEGADDLTCQSKYNPAYPGDEPPPEPEAGFLPVCPFVFVALLIFSFF